MHILVKLSNKYGRHECSHSFVQEIVCPINFINEHKPQNVKKNVITDDIECCVVDATKNNRKFVIAENIPKSVAYIWQSNFKYYFGLDCNKRFDRDLLEIETENSFKRIEKMVFKKEDKIYQETNSTCHICGKTVII